MIKLLIFIPILVSFFVTLFLIPYWMKRAKNANIVGRDINKLEDSEVAEAGGITVVSGFAFGTLSYVAIITFFFKSTNNLIEIFALLSSIFLISLVAFTDDILGWKVGLRRRTRLILVAFASIPLIVINAGKSIINLPFLGIVDLGLIYPLLLIPLGIVGVTTTFNFLAGLNGLEAGQGAIILTALSVVAYLTGNPWLTVITLCMSASLIAFLFYNIYPAKVFPGDSLTYPVGGLIAITAILGSFERIAFFFFIPYIFETILKLRGKLVKQSFGIPKKNGNLDMKYDKIYSLNHLSIFLMKKMRIAPTEKKVVVSIWVFQIILVVLGFIIWGNNLVG